MSTIIIDGKKTSGQIKDELANEVVGLKEKGVEPTLAVVLVGSDPASQVYVKHKKKACEYIGMRSLAYELDEKTTEEALLELIDELNNRDDVHGILVQLPLPNHIDEEKILLAIDPSKDVDGFHPYSVGNLSIGRDGFVSCTPAGIIELIKRYNIQIEGKNCVVIGRSNIVGKPVSMLLLKENGTVTICHSRTKNIKEISKRADILVVAIGKANFVTKDFVKEGATIIDVGMNRLENGKLCGDVKFDECSQLAGAITPVPGGVGPMTIAMLMKNCIKSATNMLK
ncbi:bifunctional protein FolD [Vallitalea longa]|uniref:Bifunctional protein FolD n=1 Tax=Vallitalea longa TaxID=2936439 RepID=A0A9W5YIB9_9FIRM|nr:bifunctional methylenetetrahydrofolate dehydrogenase/methenyltetrahydrofolate cyclohydrolase FolD [Vallitalea longa]GKX31813.1 bifunctional protein FolD [Vallitalea longa]